MTVLFPGLAGGLLNNISDNISVQLAPGANTAQDCAYAPRLPNTLDDLPRYREELTQSRNPADQTLGKALERVAAQFKTDEISQDDHVKECDTIHQAAKTLYAAKMQLSRGDPARRAYDIICNDLMVQRDPVHGIAAAKQKTSAARYQAAQDRARLFVGLPGGPPWRPAGHIDTSASARTFTEGHKVHSEVRGKSWQQLQDEKEQRRSGTKLL